MYFVIVYRISKGASATYGIETVLKGGLSSVVSTTCYLVC
jgi:hypothetical protein